MDMEEKQVSHLDGGVHQAVLPVLTAMLVQVDAKRTITQVLFFKVSEHDARLKKAEGQLGITTERWDSIRAAVAGKMQPFLVDNISKPDI